MVAHGIGPEVIVARHIECGRWTAGEVLQAVAELRPILDDGSRRWTALRAHAVWMATVNRIHDAAVPLVCLNEWTDGCLEPFRRGNRPVVIPIPVDVLGALCEAAHGAEEPCPGSSATLRGARKAVSDVLRMCSASFGWCVDGITLLRLAGRAGSALDYHEHADVAVALRGNARVTIYSPENEPYLDALRSLGERTDAHEHDAEDLLQFARSKSSDLDVGRAVLLPTGWWRTFSALEEASLMLLHGDVLGCSSPQPWSVSR